MAFFHATPPFSPISQMPPADFAAFMLMISAIIAATIFRLSLSPFHAAAGYATLFSSAAITLFHAFIFIIFDLPRCHYAFHADFFHSFSIFDYWPFLR
jgi:hypothetical protein